MFKHLELTDKYKQTDGKHGPTLSPAEDFLGPAVPETQAAQVECKTIMEVIESGGPTCYYGSEDFSLDSERRLLSVRREYLLREEKTHYAECIDYMLGKAFTDDPKLESGRSYAMRTQHRIYDAPYMIGKAPLGWQTLHQPSSTVSSYSGCNSIPRTIGSPASRANSMNDDAFSRVALPQAICSRVSAGPGTRLVFLPLSPDNPLSFWTNQIPETFLETIRDDSVDVEKDILFAPVEDEELDIQDKNHRYASRWDGFHANHGSRPARRDTSSPSLRLVVRTGEFFSPRDYPKIQQLKTRFYRRPVLDKAWHSLSRRIPLPEKAWSREEQRYQAKVEEKKTQPEPTATPPSRQDGMSALDRAKVIVDSKNC
ncbi:uncharacterized protein EV420DRAFT_1478412 [Desarmillaria tabescens]|uniref:Uncharacterized protein n=1 Tax=Armillaria tabescens TaxID=1929756 RepID=A0AA39N7V8_ARMTA|nr:uncharacterized protein EV420DRAFT_1478412 [Desarmillaria tabescens]KAK0460655.1 hypothetical protein EV420DRAFT_1478412 [Desarmillaria tabescens]